MAIRKRIVQQAVLLICMTTSLGGCRAGGGIASEMGAARVSGMHHYSTTFPLAENPIREGGNWVGGSDAGATLWGDVRTAPGFAYGVDEPTKFGDPTAIVTGRWGPEQTATATVRISKTPTGNCCHEVEVRLRTTISPKSITGYEAYCSVMPDNAYCHIARWNGPNGSYWNFETGSSATYLKDGDIIMATATGTNPVVITLFKNGAQILQATDTGAAGGGFGAFGPWPSGNPGIGFFDNTDSNWRDFGFSSFGAAESSGRMAIHSSTGQGN